MAQAGGLLDQDQFICAICLDLLKDPVAIHCGHSFCMDCIEGCWDQDDNSGVYSCPQCRETFTPRPVLSRNIMLAEVVEKLKKTGLQATPPAHCYAGPGNVACDVCTGRNCKAVKSCLVCLASYCKSHLQPHYESPPLKKHKLVEATGNLQEKICSHHDKLLEVYCRTDQQCICLLCVMDEHRGHDTVSAAAERTEKQKEVEERQSKLQQRIQEREKELQDVRQAVQSLKRSAQAAVEDSERIFTELIHSIERRRSEVKELIRDQEKAEVSWTERLLERLEQEIAELRRRDAELEQFSHTEDHIHLLQSFQSVCAPPGPGDFLSITVSPHSSFEAVRKSVSELKKQLEDIFKVELVKISKSVKEVYTVEPRTRKDFLQSSGFSFGAFSVETPPRVQPGLQLGQPANTTLGSTAAPASSAAASGPSTAGFSFGAPPGVKPGLQLGQPANTTLDSARLLPRPLLQRGGATAGFSFGAPPGVKPGLQLGQPANTTLDSTAAPASSAAASGSSTAGFSFGSAAPPSAFGSAATPALFGAGSAPSFGTGTGFGVQSGSLFSQQAKATPAFGSPAASSSSAAGDD